MGGAEASCPIPGSAQEDVAGVCDVSTFVSVNSDLLPVCSVGIPVLVQLTILSYRARGLTVVRSPTSESAFKKQGHALAEHALFVCDARCDDVLRSGDVLNAPISVASVPTCPEFTQK